MPSEPFFFIQLSDPQLGLMADRGQVSPEQGIAPEVALFEAAIAEANRLQPDFVVVTGDLSQNNMDPVEVGEIKRIGGQLHPSIPIYWAPGNRDTSYGNVASAELIERYRQEFGPDFHAFTHKGVTFVVLSSTVIFDPSQVPDEWERQLEFVGSELAASVERGDGERIIFSHHPLFTADPDEENAGSNLPLVRRRPLLELFRRHDVSAVFAGHLHRNNYARDGDMLMVVTSAVGFQGGDDGSGYRVVKVLRDRIEHEYYRFDSGPESVSL
ncbi:MAG: metallophosphoesterase [Dehalococcoidia bacterium]|nr:metallophosphoesterase [Dehalococcoidia bacterium]